MPLQTGIFAELLETERSRIQEETRSSLESPQTPLSYPAEWLLDIFNGGRTDSGIRVSELTAFQAVIFLTCVDLISASVGSVPPHVYERRMVANGRASHTIAYDHDLYDLIHVEPNPEMSRFVFFKTFMAHVLAWGNGYAEVERDAGNDVKGIWPRNPYKTRPHRLTADLRLDAVPWRPFPVKLSAGTMVYKTTDNIDDLDTSEASAQGARTDRIIPAEDMLHIPGLAFDGRIGQSVVWMARQTIGLALATEKFGAKYFANFARPAGILEMPGNQDPAAREASKRSWMEAQGGENSHRVAVMPPGYKFTPISNKPEESQMNETDTTIGTKICSMFHVPPHMAGVGRVTSRSNTEQQAQEYIQYCIGPWFTAIKLEYKRKLFPSPGIGRAAKNRFYLDFDLTDMLRPDAASRDTFYRGGRTNAYLNTNDIRAFEKLNPIEEPWAEDYWMPINMTLADTPIDPNSQDGAGNGDKNGDKPDPAPDPKADPTSARYIHHFGRLFRDAFGRVLVRDKRDLKAVSEAFGPILFSLRDAAFDLCAGQMQFRGRPGEESDRFIAAYLGAMHKRAAAWTIDEEKPKCDAELSRAVIAMRMAAYREVGALKAKSIAAVSSENNEGDIDGTAD